MAESKAKNEEVQDVQQMHELYLEGWNLYDEIEDSTLPTNGTEFQANVHKAMDHFERVTRLVSLNDIFSSNEQFDEVPTDCLQFLLLPFFLGKLTTKLTNQDLEKLGVAEIYFKDYLQRCQEYGICEVPKDASATRTSAGSGATSKDQEIRLLQQAAQSRNEKIAQYNRMKELNAYVKRYKAAVKSKELDDEVKREFFRKLIDRNIIDAKEELESVKAMQEMEKIRQQRMAAGDELSKELKSGMPPLPSHAKDHKHSHCKQGTATKPLQPFIITRDATQKAVFGLGYPSRPVLSIEEFYDQRVREGLFPDQQQLAEANKAQAQAAQQDPEELEEAEKAALEQQIEEDDAEYLARMRRMDEYKDAVRRGDGNRYNRS